MTKIIIMIDGDGVTINQSASSTKVEQKNKKFFIIMRDCNFDERSWVEFVSDNYISATNKFKDLRSTDDNSYSFRLLIQDENETIVRCNGTDWDIDR